MLCASFLRRAPRLNVVFRGNKLLRGVHPGSNKHLVPARMKQQSFFASLRNLGARNFSMEGGEKVHMQTKKEGIWSDRLLAFLNEIKDPLGTYATHGIVENWPPYGPRVTVDGIGRISFPLMDMAVEPLKSLATIAPFGRGDKTLYDESVRKAWQIDGSKVDVGGEGWDELLQKGLVRKACRELGISYERGESLNIKANLYKLLLYEAGGHFTPHRDTEKEDGMFGTLIINLPSLFTGGSFTVNHGGETKTFELSKACDEQVQYVAFYADCQHQLHPVTSGLRICLVYNLVASQSGTGPGLSHTRNNIATESQFQDFVKDWKTDPKGIARLGYHLTHKYTPNSFSISSVKGRDNMVLQALLAARNTSGGKLFNVHLLMMERYLDHDTIGDTDDIIEALMVLDRNGVAMPTDGWNMYKHSDGWLVDEEYFNRLHKDDSTEYDVREALDESHEGKGDEVHGRKVHTMFLGMPAKKRVVEEYGNDGSHYLLWYYASAIVISPAE